MILGQCLHLFSLNERTDVAKVHKNELSRGRGISSPEPSVFSNANRTRDPAIGEDFYWILYNMFCRENPKFRNTRNHGALARFKMRHVLAIDASVIPLAVSSIDWAKDTHRKSAVKLHMRTNIVDISISLSSILLMNAHHLRIQGKDDIAI